VPYDIPRQVRQSEMTCLRIVEIIGSIVDGTSRDLSCFYRSVWLEASPREDVPTVPSLYQETRKILIRCCVIFQCAVVLACFRSTLLAQAEVTKKDSKNRQTGLMYVIMLFILCIFLQLIHKPTNKI